MFQLGSSGCVVFGYRIVGRGSAQTSGLGNTMKTAKIKFECVKCGIKYEGPDAPMCGHCGQKLRRISDQKYCEHAPKKATATPDSVWLQIRENLKWQEGHSYYSARDYGAAQFACWDCGKNLSGGEITGQHCWRCSAKFCEKCGGAALWKHNDKLHNAPKLATTDSLPNWAEVPAHIGLKYGKNVLVAVKKYEPKTEGRKFRNETDD